MQGCAEGFVPQDLQQVSDKEEEVEVETTVTAIEPIEENLEYALVAEIKEAEALEPHTLAEAHERSDWTLWEQAIQEELTMLCQANTWILEEPPLSVNVIGSKWVFKAKKDAAGKVVHYKA